MAEEAVVTETATGKQYFVIDQSDMIRRCWDDCCKGFVGKQLVRTLGRKSLPIEICLGRTGDGRVDMAAFKFVDSNTELRCVFQINKDGKTARYYWVRMDARLSGSDSRFKIDESGGHTRIPINKGYFWKKLGKFIKRHQRMAVFADESSE
ncbi:MAG: hypothetical protein ABIE03_04210 [Patescibacteria group bacterium]|nr:hypothetical protein [Patescibacteria group bacterium]